MITTRICTPIAHLSTTRLVAIALLVVGAISTGPARAQAAPQGTAANDDESSRSKRWWSPALAVKIAA